MHGQSHLMFTEMLAEMLCEVDKELVNAARRETSSVLRARGYDDAMNTLSFTEIIKEIQTLSHSVQLLTEGDASTEAYHF